MAPALPLVSGRYIDFFAMYGLVLAEPSSLVIILGLVDHSRFLESVSRYRIISVGISIA